MRPKRDRHFTFWGPVYPETVQVGCSIQLSYEGVWGGIIFVGCILGHDAELRNAVWVVGMPREFLRFQDWNGTVWVRGFLGMDANGLARGITAERDDDIGVTKLPGLDSRWGDWN